MGFLIRNIRAYFATKKLRAFAKKYPDYIIFVATAGLGDICYALSYLDAMKAKTGKKVLVMVSSYAKELISFYKGIDLQYDLSKREYKLYKELPTTSLGQSVFNNRNVRSNIYTCEAWCFFPFRTLRLLDVDFFQIIRRANYELLDDDLKITYPVVPKCNLNYFNIVNWENTILINPHSNFLNTDPEIFDTIVQILHNKGYDVYTNVSSVYGKILDGTKPLQCNLIELFNILKRIKLFVSVRSGILDFSISSGGNYLVIYDWEEDGLFRKAYNLNDWKTNSIVTEFDNHQKSEIYRFVESL